MNNFKRLTDQSRINVEPTRLVLKTSSRNADLRSALISLGASQNDLEELSIINGMQLEDSVDKGTTLKLFSQRVNK